MVTKVYSKCNPTFHLTIFSIVNCGDGWFSFDNSCYKLETSPLYATSPYEGQSYCSKTYGANLVVPNSVEEATFLGQYLTGIAASAFNFYFSIVINFVGCMNPVFIPLGLSFLIA